MDNQIKTQNMLQKALQSRIGRRKILKYGLFPSGAMVLGLGACTKHNSGSSGSGVIDVGAGDTGILNFAYALEQLEATGTTYQHAIQKVSVAQAASTTLPVQQIVKKLQDLTTKAMNRVYNDEKRGYFPVAREGQFAALAHELAQDSDKAYLFNGAIAHYLADAAGWNEKLMRLLAILKEADALPSSERDAHVRRRLDDIDGGLEGGATALLTGTDA